MRQDTPHSAKQKVKIFLFWKPKEKYSQVKWNKSKSKNAWRFLSVSNIKHWHFSEGSSGQWGLLLCLYLYLLFNFISKFGDKNEIFVSG